MDSNEKVGHSLELSISIGWMTTSIVFRLDMLGNTRFYFLYSEGSCQAKVLSSYFPSAEWPDSAYPDEENIQV